MAFQLPPRNRPTPADRNRNFTGRCPVNLRGSIEKKTRAGFIRAHAAPLQAAIYNARVYLGGCCASVGQEKQGTTVIQNRPVGRSVVSGRAGCEVSRRIELIGGSRLSQRNNRGRG